MDFPPRPISSCEGYPKSIACPRLIFPRLYRHLTKEENDVIGESSANDFTGEVNEFAMVLPVPTVQEKDQIDIGDPSVLKHLSHYAAPGLVEYFDPTPCQPPYPESRAMDMVSK